LIRPFNNGQFLVVVPHQNCHAAVTQLAADVRALGPDFELYASSIEERNEIDSAYLQALDRREFSLVFALLPRAHQEKLESLFCIGSDEWESADIKDSLANGLAVMGIDPLADGDATDDDDEIVHADEALFFDLDGDSDDNVHPDVEASSSISGAEAGKKKKKKKRKKKKKAAEPEVVAPAPAPSTKVVDPRHERKIATLDQWLAKGAHLTKREARLSCMLLDASKVGHVEAVRALLKKPGIRVLQEEVGEGLKCTALHHAAFGGHDGVVELLLKRREIEVNRGDVHTPLLLAADKGHMNVISQLLEHPDIQVNKAGSNGYTALMVSSLKGFVVPTKMLLNAGADPDKAGSNNETPLILACQNNHEGVVRVLVDAGADKEKSLRNGATPLFQTCQKGHANIVAYLLEKGVDPERPKDIGATPLFIAAELGNETCVALLIKKGVDINRAKNDGCTPLHIAVHKGHRGTVKILVDAGVNKTVIFNGWTPLAVAKQQGHFDTVALLSDATLEHDGGANWSIVY
jgi:ankyrin repeat protein